MQLSNATFGWNELDFLDAGEFRQMGPPIVRLEIDRIERVMADEELAPDIADRLRRARFELTRFVAELENIEVGGESIPANALEPLSMRLMTALLNLGVPEDVLKPDAAAQIRYVIDRLAYITNRMELIY